MKIAALAGGVGGAKLADGLMHCLPPEDLTVIVNTGDDFEHFGLQICPDIDTVCYTLAGLSNQETGWGRSGETFAALGQIEKLSGSTWFRLGDSDLGVHMERTRRLRAGQSLSEITRDFCRIWGVGASVLPMSDQPVATIINTHEQGELPFQIYFVKNQCQPKVLGFRFLGIEHAKPAPGVLEAIYAADYVIFCPSNPWVSIAPILSVAGIREAVQTRPVVAISPIIGGNAVKGPAAKMFSELGITPSALAVAERYRDLLTGYVFDQVDKQFFDSIQQWGIIPYITDTMMTKKEDRQRLANEVLQFCVQQLERWS